MDPESIQENVKAAVTEFIANAIASVISGVREKVTPALAKVEASNAINAQWSHEMIRTNSRRTIEGARVVSCCLAPLPLLSFLSLISFLTKLSNGCLSVD